MSGPGTYNLTPYRGDTLSFDVVLTSAGDPTDITGYTWLAQIRQTETTAVLVELDVVVTDAANGRLTVTLPAADSAGLPNAAVWDLQSQQGSTVRTWLAGKVSPTGQVSR